MSLYMWFQVPVQVPVVSAVPWEHVQKYLFLDSTCQLLGNITKLQILYPYDKDLSCLFAGLSGRLKETMYVKCLAFCLTQSDWQISSADIITINIIILLLVR